MSRRQIVVALGALLLVFPAAVRAAGGPQTQSSPQGQSATRPQSGPQTQTSSQAQSAGQAPLTESENPINDQGSNYDYRSYVTGITPSIPGVSLQVLEFADRLILTNHSGRTVTVLGYDREPYGRVLAGGTVQLNTRSPAYYLNQNFYGDVNVPASASATAAPNWTVVDRTGRLEWHDHRIHWMSPALPPQVKDESKRTKIFDWQVPIEVGGQMATVNGELFWTPARTGAPAAAIPVLVALTVLGLLLVLFIRRRRRADRAGGGPEMSSTGGPDEPDRPTEEAW